jgi:tRNA nucleotidyltransferase (CCA-adding enzyme)
VPLIEELSERLKVPNTYRELAILAARQHTLVHRALELKPATVLTLLEKCDAFRRPERFAELLLACEADARGRAGREDAPYPQAAYLGQALAAAADVTLSESERRGLEGAEIGEEIRRRRLAAVAAVKAQA